MSYRLSASSSTMLPEPSECFVDVSTGIGLRNSAFVVVVFSGGVSVAKKMFLDEG